MVPINIKYKRIDNTSLVIVENIGYERIIGNASFSEKKMGNIFMLRIICLYIALFMSHTYMHRGPRQLRIIAGNHN